MVVNGEAHSDTCPVCGLTFVNVVHKTPNQPFTGKLANEFWLFAVHHYLATEQPVEDEDLAMYQAIMEHPLTT